MFPAVSSPAARRTTAAETAPAATEAPATAAKTSATETTPASTPSTWQNTEHLADEDRQDKQQHQEHEYPRMPRNEIAFLIATRLIHRRRLVQRIAPSTTSIAETPSLMPLLKLPALNAGVIT